MELSGKVVVVPVEWTGAAGLATRLAAVGATVVLVGPDAEAAGRLAATLEAATLDAGTLDAGTLEAATLDAGTLEPGGAGRPAVFVADGGPDDVDALASFLSELFRQS